MAACEKCWGDAYVRSLSDTSKTQYEHYKDLVMEREREGITCVAPPHEDKGAEEELEKVVENIIVNWLKSDNENATLCAHQITYAFKYHASNERNRILKIAESISFNTEDQAGNKFVVVDLEELREKLKNK